jgi:hypothetical protein
MPNISPWGSPPSNALIKGQTRVVPTSDQIDYILLDASSSMTTKWWDMLDAIDEYIKSLRKKGIDSRLLMCSFSSATLSYQWRDGPMATLPLMSDDPPGLHGGATPLYDAINTMAHTLRDLNPPQCSVTICTDGEDTGNKFTTLAQAKALLDWMRLRGWTVAFIGANFNNEQMARGLGGASQSLGTSTKRLGEAMRLLADRRARYGRTGESIEFSDAERTKFGGYLGHGG